MQLAHFVTVGGGTSPEGGQTGVGALIDDAAVLDLRAAISHLQSTSKQPNGGWPRSGSLRERLAALQTVDDVVADADVLAAAEDIVAHFKLHHYRDHPAFLSRSSVALASPLARPGNIFVACHRRNLVSGSRKPAAAKGPYPSGYIKTPSSISGPNTPIRFAPGSDKLEAAAYPAAIIGPRASETTPQEPPRRVTGYLLVVDLIAPDVHAAEQAIMSTSLGVNWPGAAILGPAVVVPASEFDSDRVEIRLSIDGAVVHTSTQADSTFTMAELVAHWSLLGLRPLDMVAGGRLHRDQGRPMPTACDIGAGSVLRVEADGLGVVETRVAEPMASSLGHQEKEEREA